MSIATPDGEADNVAGATRIASWRHDARGTKLVKGPVAALLRTVRENDSVIAEQEDRYSEELPRIKP